MDIRTQRLVICEIERVYVVPANELNDDKSVALMFVITFGLLVYVIAS